jgi:hypothetical protein
MMMYISIGMCVIGFLTVSVAMTFIIANGFFGENKDEEES